MFSILFRPILSSGQVDCPPCFGCCVFCFLVLDTNMYENISFHVSLLQPHALLLAANIYTLMLDVLGHTSISNNTEGLFNRKFNRLNTNNKKFMNNLHAHFITTGVPMKKMTTPTAAMADECKWYPCYLEE